MVPWQWGSSEPGIRLTQPIYDTQKRDNQRVSIKRAIIKLVNDGKMPVTRLATFVNSRLNGFRCRSLSLGRAILLACACAAGSAVMLGGGAAAQQPHIGAATRVVHLVTGALSSTEEPAVLRAGIDVFANEIVKTAENSAALLVFQDKTEISIGADFEIVLDRFVFDPDPAKSAIAISILSGVARFSTGVLPKSAYTIRTPSSTMTVRGTTLTITVEAGAAPQYGRRRGGTCGDPLVRKTQVDVANGAVAVTSQNETVLIDTGQSSTVECGSPPTPPFSSPPPSQALALMDTLLQQAALQTVPTPGFGNSLQNVGGPPDPGGTTSGTVMSPSQMR